MIIFHHFALWTCRLQTWKADHCVQHQGLRTLVFDLFITGQRELCKWPLRKKKSLPVEIRDRWWSMADLTFALCNSFCVLCPWLWVSSDSFCVSRVKTVTECIHYHIIALFKTHVTLYILKLFFLFLPGNPSWWESLSTKIIFVVSVLLGCNRSHFSD